MIRITNCDDRLRLMENNAKKRKHGAMLPTTIRVIICGPSNCGKTKVLISLLESPQGVRFENVYSKSLQQPKYRYVENLLTSTKSAILRSPITVTSSRQAKHVQTQTSFSMTWRAIKDAVREYFSMDRYSNVNCFYLCQMYARIPNLIRESADLV